MTTEAAPSATAAAPSWQARLQRVALHPLAHVVVLCAAFLALRVVLTQWPTGLAPAAYTKPVLAFQAMAVPKALVALLFAIGVSVALLLRKLSWRDDELGKLRVIFASSALVLAWSYGLYPYNHYLGQAHLLDRALVVGLAVLVVRHPAFFPPFVWALVVVLGQFKQPLGYSWTDIDLVVDASSILVGALVLRALGLMRAQGVVFALLVLIGAQYFDAARLKHVISPTGFEWALENDIANLWVSSHLNGWLPDLSADTVLAIARFVSSVAVPLQLATLVLEAAPLVMLFSRRLTIVVLLALVAMHLGILAASGIFFWKWAVLCCAVALALYRFGRDWLQPRWMALVVAPLIFMGGKWADVGNGLAWWDTRISQYHQLWAVTDDGQRFRLDEHDLAPYDKTIAQDRFFYLHDEPNYTRTLGAATGGYRQYRTIQDAASVERVEQLIERAKGKYDEKRAKRFDRFVRDFLRSRNARKDDLLVRFLAFISPPMHIGHRAPSPQRLPRDKKVVQVDVVFREVWFDGKALHDLGEKTVREIALKR